VRFAALILMLTIVLGGGAMAEAQSPQCDAGKDLLDAGQTADARQRYNKALDEGGTGQQCGVDGLKAVAAAEAEAAKKKAADDTKLTFREAGDDVTDFVTENLPWIILVFGVWAGMLIVAALRGDSGVRVRAPLSSEDLAKGVAAAARAAGGANAPPAKIITASDETADSTAADLAKVFRIPGTVPLGDLLKRPPFSAWLSTRLDVSGAIAGGWAVIDLTLRQPFSSKRSQRFAVDLGDADDAEKTAVLALIGGAWLNGALHTDDGPPVARGDATGLADHALFRAGANRHALGKTQIARACYAAMPGGDPHDAPFAWVGSRLNEMMALKTERRWLEAAQIANEVGDFPDDTIAGDERLFFDEDQLVELLLRQRYMTAILRVDHWYAVGQQPNTFGPGLAQLKEKADIAVERLRELVDHHAAESRELEALRAAGRMVALTYQIAAGGSATIDSVRKQLGVGDFGDSRRPAVSAAGYYDAACAVSLLLARAGADDGARKGYAREGLWLLETAVAATLEARRPRVRELARTDPMLEHLEQEDPAGFANALGEPPPNKDRPNSVGGTIADIIAAITSR
jgi:hypothetical protein